MQIDIVTVFPEMVEAALDHSIVKRARERGIVTIRVVNLRDFTTDRHRTTDDVPYGGGGGMVMKIEPIARALEALMQSVGRESSTEPVAEPSVELCAKLVSASDGEPTKQIESKNETESTGVPSGRQDAVNVSLGIMKQPRIVLTDPRGPRFTQETARQWAAEPHLILLCGHYEGVDERVRQHLVTDEVSIGDYILTGGELPALVITDALTRLQPGALGDERAPDNDTFADNLLEYPHYTRPAVFNGWSVPDILLSGHHARIEQWRRWHRIHATRDRRPDLLARQKLNEADLKLLNGEEPGAPTDSEPARRNAVTASTNSYAAETAVNHTEEISGETAGRRQEESDGTGTGNHT